MKPIKIEKEKDIQLLKAIAKCGVMTEDFLYLYDINIQRLKQHIASDNIKHTGAHLIFGKLTNIYTLTSNSKVRANAEFLIHPYKTDNSQLEHDYTLLKIYNVLNYEEKESWLTETQLHMMYPNAEKTVDAIFKTLDGRTIGVEVITDSYSESTIEEKKNFIQDYCDDFIMVHTHRDIAYKL